MKTPLFTFTGQDRLKLADLPSPTPMALQIRDHAAQHWDRTLRSWFDENECGLPTEETLRNHGMWLIPHYSQQRGLMHRLFQWRGQILFEGWFDPAGGRHVIHPHTASTPKPWDKPSGQECPRSLSFS